MAVEIVDFPIQNGDFPCFSIVMLVCQVLSGRNSSMAPWRQKQQHSSKMLCVDEKDAGNNGFQLSSIYTVYI